MASAMPRAAQRRGGLAQLPRWPFTAMLALYPLWWVLGLGEMAWIPLAACMLVLMIRRGGIQAPRGFGIWLLFMVLMYVSVIGIDTSGRLIGFVYRGMLYATVTIVFVYIYNARERLTGRYTLGVVTLFWSYAVIGGFASVFFPLFSFRTPLGYVLPGGLQSNELIGEMVVRRITQFNPDSWIALEPRPSAPFLYTNQWGNVYSLALLMVIAYLIHLRRGGRFWLIVVTILLSFVPAMLTLNRGMFIGLGVAAAYLLIRFVLAGQLGRVLGIVALGGLAGIAALLLGVQDRLTERVETTSSTEDRASLYQETLDRTLQSPLFGYGAPRPSVTEGMPSAGTQGHVWTIMFSHGIPALVCFVLALLWLVIATARVRRTDRLLLHTVQLVIFVEMLYYGILPNGLILSFAAAALVLRDRMNPAGDSPHVGRSVNRRPRSVTR